MTKRTQRYRISNLEYWIKQLGYKKYEVAEGTNIPLRTLNDYCKGRTTIPHYRLETLAAFLECPISALLDDAEIKGQASIAAPHKQQRMHPLLFTPISGDILGEASNKPEEHIMDEQRREFMKQGINIAAQASFFLPALSGNLLSLSVEEYLAHCNTLVQDCWKLMQGKSLSVAENMLAFHVNFLMQIVYSKTGFRKEAAAIAVQAKIIQAILAGHRLNSEMRKLTCLEAVTCARISQDSRLLAAALYFSGFTYIRFTFPKQPEQTIPIFQEALQCLDGNEPLLRSVLHYGLAKAFAQCSNERMALENLDKAQALFPLSPERDPSFLYVDCSKAEFRSRTGRTLVDLAQHYPTHGYHEQARKTFESGLALPTASDRSISDIFIHRGAAALGIGDLELYESSLRNGLVLAKAMGSQIRFRDAYTIFQKAPPSWRTDQSIKDLEEEFFSPKRLPKGVH